MLTSKNCYEEVKNWKIRWKLKTEKLNYKYLVELVD